MSVVTDPEVLDTVGIPDSAALWAKKQEQIAKKAALQNRAYPHGRWAFGGKRTFRLPLYVDKIDESACAGCRELWIYSPEPGRVESFAPLLLSNRSVLLSENFMLPFMHNCGFDKVFLKAATGSDLEEKLDFAAYDKNFSRVMDKEEKLLIALSRLLYPYALSPEARKNYEAEVKKRFRPAMKLLVTGIFDRYGLPSPCSAYVTGLKTMDIYLKEELVKEASAAGLTHYVRLILRGTCPDQLPGRLERRQLHTDFHRLFDHRRFLDEKEISHLAADLAAEYLVEEYLGPEWGDAWTDSCDGSPDGGKVSRTTSSGSHVGAKGSQTNSCDSPDGGKASQTSCGISDGEKKSQTSCGSPDKEKASQTCWSDFLERRLLMDLILRDYGKLTWQTAYSWLRDHEEWITPGTRLLFEKDLHPGRPGAKEAAKGLEGDANPENGMDSPYRNALRDSFLAAFSEAEASDKDWRDKALAFMEDGSGMRKGSGGRFSFAGKGPDQGKTEEANLVKREGYDYREFLKQFMTLKEDRILDLDSFDPVYYTFGLREYGDMPLIEPLETKEMMRLQELVIVIDTSGSCSGRLVRFFLEETWSVFSDQENFFDHFSVRILQCDHIVQEDKEITRLSEVDEYMKNLRIRGGGTTDFRAAFDYIKKLKTEGKQRHLKGILYFTDGFGTFPKYAPPEECAFIFLKNRFAQVEVPGWAQKLLLPLPEGADWAPEYTGAFTMNI